MSDQKNRIQALLKIFNGMIPSDKKKQYIWYQSTILIDTTFWARKTTSRFK